MHNNRNKKHVREDDVMLPALAHEKHHAMGVQLLIDLIDLKRAGRSAACSAQTSDFRRTSCIVYVILFAFTFRGRRRGQPSALQNIARTARKRALAASASRINQRVAAAPCRHQAPARPTVVRCLMHAMLQLQLQPLHHAAQHAAVESR